MAKQSETKTIERWDIVEETSMAKKKALKPLFLIARVMPRFCTWFCFQVVVLLHF